jgi:hypothetical protein
MAVDNALSFTLGAGQTAFIGGLGSPNIRGLELGANDSAVREVVVKAQVAGSS